MVKIIKYIISFILMLAIVASILMGIVENTIASKEYFLNKLEETSFYDNIEAEIKDSFLNYILQSGMNETVFENIFDKEKVRTDINNLVDAIYENTPIEVETDSVRTKLTENINKYIQENKLTVNNRSEIESFTNTIVSCYENGILISRPVIEKITPTTSKMVKMVKEYAPKVYIVTVILAIILIIINLKQKTEIAKYFGVTILSVGAILTIIKLYITSQINIESISIINKVLTDLIHNVSNYILNTILYIGIASIIIGFILIIINILCIKEKRESKH